MKNLALVLLLAGCGIGHHSVVPAQLPASRETWHTWEEVFAHPTDLAVVAHNTGDVQTGPRVLIDAKDPRTPADQKVTQWVPAISYLVRHRTEGAFLMDAGMRVADAGGHCDFGAKPFFWAPCTAQPGQDIASQLATEGVEVSSLRFVLVSHLHGDHAGGLHALGARGPVRLLLAPEEWKAASSAMRLTGGYMHDLLDGRFDVSLLPMERAVEMPLLGRVLDLFGDGSVWIIPAHGHTHGELAVLLNAKAGPILFTFDSVHLRAGLEHGVTPGFTVDKKAAIDTMARLAVFHAAYPSIAIVYGHEPTQWKNQPRSVVLTAGIRPGLTP